MNTLKTSLALGALAFGALAFGCGGATMPPEKLASTEASLRAAQEVGADKVPKAELHVRLAKEELDAARKKSQDGNAEDADRLLDRARADADLALALSRQAEAEQTLERANVVNPSAAPVSSAQ
jgi:hypothetical protein